MKRGGPLRRKTPLRQGKPLSRIPAERRSPAEPPVSSAPKPRRDTGFSAAAKLLIRTRAGNGDPEQALCEACAMWLGRYGGQVHHRMNRQMGGSRHRNRVSNGSLLCGTPEVGDHGEATRLAPRMREMGFVLESWQVPEHEPVMLHGEQGGLLAWLDDSGHYVDEDGNVQTAPALDGAA